MIFLSYEFVWFAIAFFGAYLLCPWGQGRLGLIVVGGIAFQLFYGGWASVLPIVILAVTTYFAARTKRTVVIRAAIAICAISLIFYKYATFLVSSLVEPLLPVVGQLLVTASRDVAPAAIPLGISFFTFEFVHYLTDIDRGGHPIRRLQDFLAFALFWPTMVAGPIKRYQQFIPTLKVGLSGPTSSDAMYGLIRIAIGFTKKWAADNLTGWIEFAEPHFASNGVGWRWLFLVALAFRILLDFSGYSDMAIGYARVMGIVVPENFNWPYFARSPIQFWQRWHMSLSLWIRDYIYIPLGGNRLGLPRRTLNALTAMAVCGLWHGPSWHFVVWGLYHGLGLTVAAMLERVLASNPIIVAVPKLSIAGGSGSLSPNGFATDPVVLAARATAAVLGWGSTMIFVSIGWLLFFYPVDRAVSMAMQLFGH
jgi:alginate O-acetyltransferase complex protein AlgI